MNEFVLPFREMFDQNLTCSLLAMPAVKSSGRICAMMSGLALTLPFRFKVIKLEVREHCGVDAPTN